MGFGDGFLGFDFNMDGKINMQDDVLFMCMMDEEEKARKQKHLEKLELEGIDPDDIDLDEIDIDEFDDDI